MKQKIWTTIWILYVVTFQQQYGVYISQLILYSRVYGTGFRYEDFLNGKLLLTRKLLSQGFHLITLKLSLLKYYGRYQCFLSQPLRISERQQQYKELTTQKTKDRSTLKSGGKPRCSGQVPAPLVTPDVLL
jgi:hypothetical protein